MNNKEEISEVDLPKVNFNTVLLIIFGSPVFFYPLFLLLATSFVPVPGYEFIEKVLGFFIWTYPFILVFCIYILNKIAAKDSKKGRFWILVALGLEFLFTILLAILMV